MDLEAKYPLGSQGFEDGTTDPGLSLSGHVAASYN